MAALPRQFIALVKKIHANPLTNAAELEKYKLTDHYDKQVPGRHQRPVQ